MSEDVDNPTSPETPLNRELAIFHAGGLCFAIYADAADSVTESARPTPLPGAPPAVLGVVCVRGRMRTVIDPAYLIERQDEIERLPTRFIVSLRGDEQLAIAVERVERFVDVSLSDLEPPAYDSTPVRGLFHLGDTVVNLLDPTRVFDAALQGLDRRRHRS
jgi:purine-binding chemotaxis protein CheW